MVDSNGNVITVGGGKSVITVREPDSSKVDGYKYTRFSGTKVFNSFVYRNDERRSSTDNNHGGTFDNHNSANYYMSHSASSYNNAVENNPAANEDDYVYTNFGKNKILNGGGGTDYFYNWGMTQSTILGGTGNDTIYNAHNSDTSYVTIDAGEDNDYVYNNSQYVSVVAGVGADTVYNYGDDVTINGDDGSNAAGDGGDSIVSYGDRNTISGGSGQDTIYNYSPTGRATISSGDGKDTIYNHSFHATINGGAGNDSIIDDTANSMVEYIPGEGPNVGSGKDTVTFAKTIDCWGKDNLTHYYGGGLLAINSNSVQHVYNSYSNTTTTVSVRPRVYVVTGQSSFSINNYSLQVTGVHTLNVGGQTLKVNSNCFTIREGTATDNYKYTRYWAGTWTDTGVTAKKFNSYVYLNDKHNQDTLGTYDDPHSADNYKANAVHSLTSDSDYFYTNFGSGKVIDALEGDDYLSNYGATQSTIIGGAGNDTIYNKKGAKLNHTCLTGANTSYVTIDGGTENDYIYNESDYVSINAGTDNDTVYNYNNSYTTVDGGVGDDSIYNYSGSYASIVSGDGQDTIYNYYGTRVTMDGGAADDKIYNYSGSYASIVSGDGKDTVYNTGSNVTIDSGADEDTIYSSGSSSSIVSGDGKDTIYGWRALNGHDYEIDTAASNISTYAVGRNKTDLLVVVSSVVGGGSIRFVDVLEPVPPFDTLVAVTVDNNTALNAKVKPNDKKASIYDLNNASTIFGGTGDKATIADDGSLIVVKNDSRYNYEQVTVGSDEEKVTLISSNDPTTVQTYDSFPYTGIITVSAGVGTVVGSGMKSTGVNWITNIKNVILKEPVRSEILAEDVKTITRTAGIKIVGNNANNLIIGGEGDDTLEGGAGNDTLTGHVTVRGSDQEIEYISDDSNIFAVRTYQPVKPYTGTHVNTTTITDYKENDVIKVAAGHITAGTISATTKKKVGGTIETIAGTVSFTVENSGTNHNKATVKVLESNGSHDRRLAAAHASISCRQRQGQPYSERQRRQYYNDWRGQRYDSVLRWRRHYR